MERLTVDQVLDAGLDDWRLLAQGLHARFRTGDMATGVEFVAAVVEAANAADHHPDVTLAYPRVDLRLVTHDAGNAVTTLDVDLARRISDLAAERGLAASPSEVVQLELGLDTADAAAIRPFWSALLTGDAGNVDGDDVVDPTGRVPLVWFQPTAPHDTPRQRFHLDVWVPHDEAEARIAAAVDAGGEVVDDREAPSFWVLADAEGNRACVCTSLQR